MCLVKLTKNEWGKCSKECTELPSNELYERKGQDVNKLCKRLREAAEISMDKANRCMIEQSKELLLRMEMVMGTYNPI